MAIPSHDGTARGASSMDGALALPCRPENLASQSRVPVRSRLSVFARPADLAVDETVPAVHRSRRHRTAHQSAPQVPEEQVGFFASTALAVVSLVFVSAVALVSMLVSAAILHVISPDRRFDTFRALHEPWVIGLLFGLGVLWLLPPYPWAVKPAQSEPKKNRRLFRAKAAT
jgi:hypothetical protein